MIAIIYWSETGNTETMAEAIRKGIEQAGETAELIFVDAANADTITNYDKIAFGCPARGVDELEQDEFEPYFESIEAKLTGKPIARFGSYGWGDGEWMEDWVERTNAAGAKLYTDGGFIMQEDELDEDACVAFGEGFAAF